MSGYQQGRADGLHEAVEIIRALEEKVALKLERSSSIKTRNARQVRWQAYRVAKARITTALNKRDRQVPGFAAALKRMGL